MRVIPIALAEHYALPGTTLCTCLRIERQDGAVLGISSVDVTINVDGLDYKPGLDIASLVSTSSLAVDNTDASVLKIIEVLTDADLEAGLMDNARFTLFECNYMAPEDGVNVLKRGTTGQAKIAQGMWTIEFRGLKQALQQSLGAVTSKTCRARLGDSACKVDLAPFTFNLTVTSVASPQVFTSTGATQADDYFVEGQVTMTSGASEGYSRKVKVFDSGVFTLATPMPFEIGIGDTFTAIAGCQKRHDRTTANPAGVSDCLDKFDNVLNFQGEPHLPGVDGLTALPDQGGDGT